MRGWRVIVADEDLWLCEKPLAQGSLCTLATSG